MPRTTKATQAATVTAKRPTRHVSKISTFERNDTTLRLPGTATTVPPCTVPVHKRAPPQTMQDGLKRQVDSLQTRLAALHQKAAAALAFEEESNRAAEVMLTKAKPKKVMSAEEYLVGAEKALKKIDAALEGETAKNEKVEEKAMMSKETGMIEPALQTGKGFIGGGARLPSKKAVPTSGSSPRTQQAGTPPGWYRADQHPALVGKQEAAAAAPPPKPGTPPGWYRADQHPALVGKQEAAPTVPSPKPKSPLSSPRRKRVAIPAEQALKEMQMAMDATEDLPAEVLASAPVNTSPSKAARTRTPPGWYRADQHPALVGKQEAAAAAPPPKPGTPPGWYRADQHPALVGKQEAAVSPQGSARPGALRKQVASPA